MSFIRVTHAIFYSAFGLIWHVPEVADAQLGKFGADGVHKRFGKCVVGSMLHINVLDPPKRLAIKVNAGRPDDPCSAAW